MVGMQGRASMQSADSASASGEGDAKGLVPPQHAQVDTKAATVLTEICAKCRPCCRGTASEGEWPSPVESPVRMLSDAAASPPSEAFTFSMPSTLAARSSAVEPESRPSGANVDDGANGPESALCADQSSDLGLSSGGLSHELEAVVPQSRNSPAGIFRVAPPGGDTIAAFARAATAARSPQGERTTGHEARTEKAQAELNERNMGQTDNRSAKMTPQEVPAAEGVEYAGDRARAYFTYFPWG